MHPLSGSDSGKADGSIADPIANRPARVATVADLLQLVQGYPPHDAVEGQHRDALIALLEQTGAPFSATQFDPGHVTASACVVSRTGRRLLLIRHPTLGAWMQPGGHVEVDDPDLASAALREALEETGLSPTPVTALPFDLDVHPIPARRGMPAHRHYDVRFLATVDGLPVASTPEQIEWRWFDPAELPSLGIGPSVARMVEKARIAGLL
ncbi:MAG: NUDIX hydrolase [Acidobacteriota bacterium]